MGLRSGGSNPAPLKSLNHTASIQSISLSVSQSVCLYVCLSVCQSVGQSVNQSVCLSVYLFVNQSVSQSINVCLSISLSVSQSVCQTDRQTDNTSLSDEINQFYTHKPPNCKQAADNLCVFSMITNNIFYFSLSDSR